MTLYHHIPGQEGMCRLPTMTSATYMLIMFFLRLMPYPRTLSSPLTCWITCAVVQRAYIFWLCSLFGNESGHGRVCLGVNSLALAPILLANLLLGRLSLVGALTTTVVVPPSSPSSGGRQRSFERGWQRKWRWRQWRRRSS